MEALLDVKIRGAIAVRAQKYPIVRILYEQVQHVRQSERLACAERSQQEHRRRRSIVNRQCHHRGCLLLFLIEDRIQHQRGNEVEVVRIDLQEIVNNLFVDLQMFVSQENEVHIRKSVDR